MPYDTREEAAAPITGKDLAKLRESTASMVMQKKRAADRYGVGIDDVDPTMLAMLQAEEEEALAAERGAEEIDQSQAYRGAV